VREPTSTNTPTLTHIALHVRDLDATVRFYQSFCRLSVVHERDAGDEQRVVWMAEPKRQHEVIFVVLSGGRAKAPTQGDYGHFGFACASRAEVDRIADLARVQKCLLWEPRDEPYPVGYYCGVVDPDGNAVEFSWGQPLGPGAPKKPNIEN
jgi:catechol 2,3-dioxygenase-like lactoylglutathione lyase family enzyme